MSKPYRFLWLVPVLFLIGCASFSTHVFRMEQTSVDVAYGAYGGYTNWLLTSFADPKLTPERRAKLVVISNDVKQARLRFAASVATVEAMRLSYETNSALKPVLEASLLTITDQSSNLCWLVNYWRTQ